MRNWKSYIILASFCINTLSSYSQINCTVPVPPVLTLVSVQPETGITELSWTLSPSSDVAAYIIYYYSNDNGNRGDSIATLWNPSGTGFNYSSTAYKYFSKSFVVSSYRLPVIPGMLGCTSPFSNVLNTIFAQAAIDTCNKKIVVSWNSYPSVPKKVTDYSILVSVNGSSYSESAKVSPDALNFTINEFQINAEYCFVIRANLEGGLFSTSNKACLSTRMQRPPLWINADYATVNAENKISLSFTIDPASEIKRYRLEKKTGLSGGFHEIAQPSSLNGSVIYNDDLSNVDTIYYYRLSAINNCNIPVTISNLCSNIVLSLEKKGNDLNLSWNSNKEWLGIVSSYRLFINTGNGFAEKAVIQPPDTVYTLAYQEIMYEVSGKEVCFYIISAETSNPYGIKGQSLSSRVCYVPEEVITVPNVFTPNNDLVNDFFRPVLSFTPVNYQLIISDRHGKILFETKDFREEWDGSQDRNQAQQEVCLWFLKVTTPSGRIVSKTGTLTIIHSRQ
jgi:gliding motility-associated-like protein